VGKLLIEKGANINDIVSSNQEVLVVLRELAETEMTPLTISCAMGYTKTVKIMERMFMLQHNATLP
jgi:ABC-type polar amino acid transport system ATPase subunit